MALGKETRKGDGGWFPSIIGPNDIYARNRSAEEDVVPTPYYDATTMPKFRENPKPSDVVNEEYIDTETQRRDSGSGRGPGITQRKGY